MALVVPGFNVIYIAGSMGQKVSIDIGQVHTKVSVLLPDAPVSHLSSHWLHFPSSNSTVYFYKYRNDDLLSFRSNPIYLRIATSEKATIKGTGSNLARMAGFLSEAFQVEVESMSTTELVILALDYVMDEHPESFFTYQKVNWPLLPNGRVHKAPERMSNTDKSMYPYILANLRSGLSVYRVDSLTSAHRVSGSSMGGSTFASIIKLGTSFPTVCQALDAATNGDNSAVDVTVGDIYGSDYAAIGLKKDLIASSCGKLRTNSSYREEDLARSVAMMLALNVAQIVALTAQAEGISTVLVAGSALEAEPIMRMLKKAMNCWAPNQVKLVFCDYGVYLASLGGVLAARKSS